MSVYTDSSHLPATIYSTTSSLVLHHMDPTTTTTVHCHFLQVLISFTYFSTAYLPPYHLSTLLTHYLTMIYGFILSCHYYLPPYTTYQDAYRLWFLPATGIFPFLPACTHFTPPRATFSHSTYLPGGSFRSWSLGSPTCLPSRHYYHHRWWG